MPLANGSLSPIIFGSVRFYHGILVGPNIGVAVYDGSRRLSIFGVTTAAAGQLRTAPRHAIDFSQDRTRQGSGLRILKIPIPQPATSCDFFPQNEPSRQSTILGSLLGRPSLKMSKDDGRQIAWAILPIRESLNACGELVYLFDTGTCSKTPACIGLFR